MGPWSADLEGRWQHQPLVESGAGVDNITTGITELVVKRVSGEVLGVLSALYYFPGLPIMGLKQAGAIFHVNLLNDVSAALRLLG